MNKNYQASSPIFDIEKHTLYFNACAWLNISKLCVLFCGQMILMGDSYLNNNLGEKPYEMYLKSLFLSRID